MTPPPRWSAALLLFATCHRPAAPSSAAPTPRASSASSSQPDAPTALADAAAPDAAAPARPFDAVHGWRSIPWGADRATAARLLGEMRLTATVDPLSGATGIFTGAPGGGRGWSEVSFERLIVAEGAVRITLEFQNGALAVVTEAHGPLAGRAQALAIFRDLVRDLGPPDVDQSGRTEDPLAMGTWSNPTTQVDVTRYAREGHTSVVTSFRSLRFRAR